MRLVLKCFSNNEHYDADCSAALVDLTPAQAVIALQRITLFEKLKSDAGSLHQMVYWEAWADFFDLYGQGEDEEGNPLDLYEELQERLERCSVVEVPQELSPEIKSTECDRIVVDEFGISFQAYPRHTSLTISTETIDVPTLRRAAGLDKAQAA